MGGQMSEFARQSACEGAGPEPPAVLHADSTYSSSFPLTSTISFGFCQLLRILRPFFIDNRAYLLI
jgi:hypothetical protein